MAFPMKTLRFIAPCLYTLFVASSHAASPPKSLLEQVNNSYICLFNSNIVKEQVPNAARQAATRNQANLRHIFNSGVHGFSAQMSNVAARRLAEQNPNIEICEKNGLAQAGARGGNNDKPGKQNIQNIPENISLTGGPVDVEELGLTAWILDSGIDTGHNDLNVGIEDGANFVDKGKNSFEDGSGHGTHVAGILAAKDNEVDIVGVAAGARVVPVRVMHNSNWATIDDMVAGISYVHSKVVDKPKGKDVANMSIWTWGHYQSLHQASQALADEIPFVVIAGNDGEDINERPSEPAHVKHPNLYTVSAVDMQGIFGDFSNFGHESQWTDCDGKSNTENYPCGSVNIAAYGVDIISLKPGGGLTTWYGTSMAAPHVAGVILVNGVASSSGNAINDPDNVADPIAHF